MTAPTLVFNVVDARPRHSPMRGWQAHTYIDPTEPGIQVDVSILMGSHEWEPYELDNGVAAVHVSVLALDTTSAEITVNGSDRQAVVDAAVRTARHMLDGDGRRWFE